MLSLYYRSSTFFLKLCHMLSWIWKTSMKAGTEEAEEQARHAWKDEVMREETRHKDSQRETCHRIGRILRIVFILWILLQGRASMKRVGGREKETNNNFNTYYSDERIPRTLCSHDCLACQQNIYSAVPQWYSPCKCNQFHTKSLFCFRCAPWLFSSDQWPTLMLSQWQLQVTWWLSTLHTP